MDQPTARRTAAQASRVFRKLGRPRHRQGVPENAWSSRIEDGHQGAATKGYDDKAAQLRGFGHPANGGPVPLAERDQSVGERQSTQQQEAGDKRSMSVGPEDEQ